MIEKMKLPSADRVKTRVPQLISDFFKIVVMLAFVFPFYWMIITAFKTYPESMQVPPTMWPTEFSLEGFYAT